MALARRIGGSVFAHMWLYFSTLLALILATHGSAGVEYSHCPITTGKKEIALITKEFFAWYNALNLPQAIDEVEKRTKAATSVSKVKEIEVNAFGDETIIRVMSDKKTFLIFNSFPPPKSKLTKQQTDNFETLLSDAIKKKVVRDDRELFVIFDDSQKMIDEVIAFLQSYSQ